MYDGNIFLEKFKREAGIVDGKVDAILAGLESPEYNQWQCRGAMTTTTASAEPTKAITMADVEDWKVRLEGNFDNSPTKVPSTPWWKPVIGLDRGAGKDYSRINFHFKSRIDDLSRRLIDELWADFKTKSEPVDPREWRELYEREFGVGDLLSDDRHIPHEE